MRLKAYLYCDWYYLLDGFRHWAKKLYPVIFSSKKHMFVDTPSLKKTLDYEPK